MPIELALASSHAPSLFAYTIEGWERAWRRFSGSTPPPPEIASENGPVIESYIKRAAHGFAALKEQVTAYGPEVVIVVAGDQDEWFGTANIPNIMMYTGTDDIVGVHNFGADDHDPPLNPRDDPERFGVRLRVNSDVAKFIQKGLVTAGFDVASSEVQRPRGNRPGAPHALVRPLPLILPSLDIPIVPIIIKTVERSAAVMTGRRCLELGRRLAEICRSIDLRIAIYGSGGLSHDPLGPRAGWVDEPLDRWVLEHMQGGKPDALRSLFGFQSAALQSGTGEIRCWLPVAAAADTMQPGVRAVLVDYFPARKSTAGCGWMYWPSSTGSSAQTSFAMSTKARASGDS
jgi:hypothetical protein